jgi:hypothetical protein
LKKFCIGQQLMAQKHWGWENELGSFEIGKKPGIVHISNIEQGKITPQSTAKKII